MDSEAGTRSGSVFGQHPSNAIAEGRQFCLDHVPHDIQVDFGFPGSTKPTVVCFWSR